MQPGQHRETARVLLLDAQNRVFLLQTHFDPEVQLPPRWLTPGGGIDPGETPRQAAARELFEETGLVLGAPGSGRTKSPEWRDFLATGHLPHLEPLRFVGRAITPPVRPRRFDARFFTVEAHHLVSLDPGAGCGELDEIAWFDWDEAEKLDLPSITRAILADVAARLDDPTRPIPYHRFDNGRNRLLTL